MVNNQFAFNSKWSGSLTLQANNFHHTKERNSHIGLALAFPFSTTTITTSGFETFGDNQFVTGITAFPIRRDQRKYQFRYDVARLGGNRAVVNGVQTSLDQFRGTPYSQIDLRVSRDFRWGERATIKPFVEFFNLLNRTNPGNNFIPDLAALPVPAGELDNAMHICVDAACTTTRPIRSLRDLRAPAGALGDFFGPGTTVGIPFAAQLGVRVSF